MKNVAFFGKALTLLALVGCAATVLGAGAPLEYIKNKTLQNLASNPSKFHGHYLSIDDAGQSVLSAASNQDESGSIWEFKKLFWKERGYVTHAIIQRGNNKFNGQFLAIDAKTGKLMFSKTEVPTARWLIRYAGKFEGWDAYYIQNLAETGAFDMQFIAIDEATGTVQLSPKPTSGAHWLMGDAPYLPAESLYQ